MNDSDEINKYIASFDDVLQFTKGDQYKAQTHKYTAGFGRQSNFDPALVFASNVKYFLTTSEIEYIKNSRVPNRIIHSGYVIFENGKLHISNFISLFIHLVLNETCLNRDGFNVAAYYSQFHQMIDLHGTDPATFYVEYGVWFKIEPNIIDGLLYIASWPDFINAFATNSEAAIHNYYNSGTPKITFSPAIYIASNWPRLDDFVTDGKVNIHQATEYYITRGFHEHQQPDSFNSWQYLADNPKYINELLRENGFVERYVCRLAPTKVAELYIQKKGKNRKSFDATAFVKCYLDDDIVNKDKQLCIDNAAEYFVKNYVTNKEVRWRTKGYAKTVNVIRDRLFDSFRQIPFHIIRWTCGKF